MLSKLGDQILATVLEMSKFLLLSLAVSIVLLIALLIATRGTDGRSKRMRVLGLLFGLGRSGALWMSQAIVKELFIISVAVFHIEVTAHVIAFYGGLLIVGLAAYRRTAVRFIAELVNGAVTVAALIGINAMWVFITDVRSDPAILTVYILMSVFAAVYNLYVTAKDMGDLLERA